jgi:hypothetical protein
MPEGSPAQWSNTVLYMIGDIVSYNGVVYTCIQNILSSGYGPFGSYIGSYWIPGTTVDLPSLANITLTAFAFSPSNETEWTDEKGTRSMNSYITENVPNYRDSIDKIIIVDMDTLVFPPFLSTAQQTIILNAMKTGINTRLLPISGPITLFTKSRISLSNLTKGLGIFSTLPDSYNSNSYTANLISILQPGSQSFINTYALYTVDITVLLYPTITGPNPSVTPYISKPQIIVYNKIVSWGLASTNVNFVTAGLFGHRVCISIPVDTMNQIFVWTRASGEVAPTGRLANPHANGSSPLQNALIKGIQGGFEDIDGVAAGLNFSTTATDMAGDLKRDPSIYNIQTDTGLSRNLPATGISRTHYGANDLVMAYLMFKCFGASAYDPTNIIYNIDDAFNMLSTEQLAKVITDSLEAEDALANAAVLPNGKGISGQFAGDNKGEVDSMFRAFLAADPLRYFLNGVEIPGLFEQNFVSGTADPSASGNWCLTVGDKLEIPLQLVFRSSVNVLSSDDNIQNPSSNTPDSVNTNFIKGEANNFNHSTSIPNSSNTIKIRLQLTCVAPLGSLSGATSGVALPFQISRSPAIIFYTPANYGVQTALALVVAGGTPPYNYSFGVLPTNFPSTLQGLSINSVTGIITFRAAVASTSATYDAAVAAGAIPSTSSIASINAAKLAMDNAGGASGILAIVSKKYSVPIIILDSSSPVSMIVANVNITFDNGAGSSNA